MTDLQRRNLLSTIGYMQQTLGFSLKGAPAYEALIAKSSSIAACKSSYSQEGDNHKVTIIVQVNCIQRLLQRYWVSYSPFLNLDESINSRVTSPNDMPQAHVFSMRIHL